MRRKTWHCKRLLSDQDIAVDKLFLPRSGSKCPTLPLYRQEKIFGRAGLPIACSTLAQWVGACSG
jgi:hypothetical protein